jgi:putative colanic acid biosynthesis UDP-glucose lipid carrier transferase
MYFEAVRLKELWNQKEYGYIFFGYFSDKVSNLEVTGSIKDIKSFVIENAIDEVYCSLDEVSNEQLKELIEFADENNKTIKFIPDTKEILTKNLKLIITIFFLFYLCTKLS